MNNTSLYFAFGSNLHPPQMSRRCPESLVMQPAILGGYRIAFCGMSKRWKGGVATILAEDGPDMDDVDMENGDRDGATLNGVEVPGLLYRLTELDVSYLNEFEGVPNVYRQFSVNVRGTDGRAYEAFTYQKLEGDMTPPSMPYFHQIWSAYKTFGFDESGLLQAVEEALSANGGPSNKSGGS